MPHVEASEPVIKKYVARVTQVLRTGIHKIGTVRDGKVIPIAELPLPNRVEIELKGDPSKPCMMFRYTDSNDFCGDTWHESLDAAFGQAEFEYGILPKDFSEHQV